MLNKKDFIELEYTAKISEGGMVFATTDEKTAKENGIFAKEEKYSPVILCLGEGYLLQGLENKLIGKEEGKEYSFNLEPEEAFGKKSASMVHLVSTKKFRESNIAPMPGLQVNIDGVIGIVKTVSGGRTMVDFNHPLSGKKIEYSVKVLRKVADDKEKLKAYLRMVHIGSEPDVKEGNASIELPFDVGGNVKEKLSEKIREVIPSIKSISFTKKESK
ncbi:peptidylprolyl isomerase [Candidatus Woesearchaeota archaeon]|nr:peptidylprolyl isomerase [Candidatus Woesearchaeota archaeon]